MRIRKPGVFWSVHTRNILCKLDHSPGKAHQRWLGKAFFRKLDRSLNTKNNKASEAVSKRHQQLQRDHDIGHASYFRLDRHISFRRRWQQRSHE